MSTYTPPAIYNNLLPREDESVPFGELGHIGRCQKRIRKETIESIAFEKYRANVKGINMEYLEIKYSVKESKAQRSLKYFYSVGFIFTVLPYIHKLQLRLVWKNNPDSLERRFENLQSRESQSTIGDLSSHGY